MDYKEKFSEDVGSFFRSPVREIFRKVDLNSIYSFAGGYPSADTFPLEEIRRTMSEVIDKYGARAFQYGATQGVPELPSWRILSRRAVAEGCAACAAPSVLAVSWYPMPVRGMVTGISGERSFFRARQYSTPNILFGCSCRDRGMEEVSARACARAAGYGSPSGRDCPIE